MYGEIFESISPFEEPKRGKGIIVTEVDPGSIGECLGLEPGDRIIRANGRIVNEYLDFQFYTGSEDHITLEIKKSNGRYLKADVEAGEGDLWGLGFESFSPRQCANDCIFCFCNQNPEWSRSSLFFKDEDFRLSFLHGNYTTLSSASKRDLERIIEQRMSPQYVSVHATDHDVRRFILGRKRADDLMRKMRLLVENGIELHAQVVLCPTINDGKVLRKTLHDLAQLFPGLKSVAIVPVVFTDRHNHRHLLTRVSDEYARAFVREARKWQNEYKDKLGFSFAFLADEFYLRAGARLPGQAHYGDYPQIEDGVGMVRHFLVEAKRTLKKDIVSRFHLTPGLLNGAIATGLLFYPILKKVIDELNLKFKTALRVTGVKNGFFGEEVTVAGLLCGRDILAAHKSLEGDFVIVPKEACLKDGRIFLDDITLEDLERELRRPVIHGGGTLLEMIKHAVVTESQLK